MEAGSWMNRPLVLLSPGIPYPGFAKGLVLHASAWMRLPVSFPENHQRKHPNGLPVDGRGHVATCECPCKAAAGFGWNLCCCRFLLIARGGVLAGAHPPQLPHWLSW
jgi:hypothetical protein